MTAHVQQIRQQQRELLAELDKQRIDHAQRALQLVADPTDPDLIEAVEASVARIEALQKRLALFEAAISGAHVKDAQDAEAARLSFAVEARERAKGLCVKREAVAGQIDKTIAVLGKQLAEFNDLSAQISRAAHDCTKSITDKDDRFRLQKLHQTASLARAGIDHSLGVALVAAHVGDALAEGRPDPLGMFKRAEAKPLAECLNYRQDKLLAHLDAQLRGV
ncbi:hypothetical protein CXK94_08360 [Stutzerimonas stutzeri]|uniref:Uncharacterized protein n=1 Tax=Stutzerimonas stutzeri TaxID=316 RepID=A0A2N8T661_STUST|nr:MULTISPECIES: hypothetical protein [Pseudomonadaceae]MCQ4325762.1 hypothetical protein [Stutzerimonas stutzeri]PNG10192.1 hypothetical protein CXK94_08360 [Stutzerimonas stutzeri]UIP88227.1 hypothetical protein HU825_17415 [Pseudomonas phenolilytica]